MNEMAVPRPNNLDAFWMPYTDNRYFKAHPRMLARAEGMSYFTPEGREVLDATAGLWCCNAGHGRREITEAIQRQAAVLDFIFANCQRWIEPEWCRYPVLSVM